MSDTRIDEEIARCRQALRDGAAELAWLYARNAAALASIAERPDPDRSAKAAALLDSCRGASRTLSRTCSDCGGSGRQATQLSTLAGSTLARPTRGKPCETCAGTGFMTVPATAAETKRAKGEAQRAYATQQRGRQYWPIGNAWAPPEVQGLLSARQTATLLTVTASPCESCMGLGREDCPACAGTGRAACPNGKCVKGWVTERRKGELIKSAEHTVRVRCPECNGQGVVLCEACRASGSRVCAACDGRGERALCAKCNGQGVAPCRRCKGAGEYKRAPCPECGGEGLALCRGCNGDGREE